MQSNIRQQVSLLVHQIQLALYMQAAYFLILSRQAEEKRNDERPKRYALASRIVSSTAD